MHILVTNEWSVGGLPLFFPEHVGLPFAFHRDEYYLFQIHYDNPASRSDLKLGFSLEFYYTNQLRPYDLGVLAFGAQIAEFGKPPLIVIPPFSLNHTISGYCSEACTTKLFPEKGINVVSAKLHSHTSGRAIRLVAIRKGRELPVMIDDNYNFNYQPFRLLREEMRLLPGDAVASRCTFDTSLRENATVEGFSTVDEMCHGFVYYYPRLGPSVTSTVCMSDITEEAYANFLQIETTTWYEKTREELVTAPVWNAATTTKEALTKGIQWDERNRRRLQEFHEKTKHESFCRTLRIPDNLYREQFTFDYVPRQVVPYVKGTRCNK